MSSYNNAMFPAAWSSSDPISIKGSCYLLHIIPAGRLPSPMIGHTPLETKIIKMQWGTPPPFWPFSVVLHPASDLLS